MSTGGGHVVRANWPALSFRVHGRVVRVVLGLGVLALLAVLLHLTTGEYRLTPIEVLAALAGLGGPETELIVQQLRLPRALVALCVGIALALSGALLQGITRNPLVAPEILGVTHGASLGAVLVIAILPTSGGLVPGAYAYPSVPLSLLPVFTFTGALAAAACTYILAWQGSIAPTRLIVVGIGVAAVGQSITSLMIATVPSISQVSELVLWVIGTVYGRGWNNLAAILPWLLILVPVAHALAREVDVSQLGDEVARGLGSPLEPVRGAAVLVSVGLAAAAVATAGPIAFVGLLAPHIARRLVGPLHGAVLAASALVGGSVVVLADVLGRTLFAPVEVPAGAITAAVGAPYLLFLLWRTRNQ